MLTAIIILGGLSLLSGLILSIASRVFYVYVDPRIDEVEDALAGANCGGCGYPGCHAAAEAVVRGEAPVTVRLKLDGKPLDLSALTVGTGDKQVEALPATFTREQWPLGPAQVFAHHPQPSRSCSNEPEMSSSRDESWDSGRKAAPSGWPR